MSNQSATSPDPHKGKPDHFSISKKRKVMKKELKEARKKNTHHAITQSLNVLSQSMLQAYKAGNKDKKLQSIQQIIQLVKKNFDQIQNTSTFSRSLQHCLKYGSSENRSMIWQLLKDKLIPFINGKYTVKLLIKMFNYGNKQAKHKITNELLSKVDTFFGVGSQYWEHIYSNTQSIPRQREIINALILPKILLVKIPSLTIRRTFSDMSNMLDSSSLKLLNENIFKVIEKSVDKELLNRTPLHTIIKDFSENSDETTLNKLLETLGDGIHQLSTTKDGVECLSRLIGYASAKQRKTLIKTYKGKFYEMATNSVDYILLMRLITVTDDTKLTITTIFKELTESLKGICFDKFGTKIILHVLSPFNKSYLSEYELKLLRFPSPTSLKENSTRFQELQSSILPLIYNLLLSKQQPPVTSISFLKDLGARKIYVEMMRLSPNQEATDILVNEIKLELLNFPKSDLFHDNIAHRSLVLLIQISKNVPIQTSSGILIHESICKEMEGHLNNILTSKGIFCLLDCIKNFSPSPSTQTIIQKLTPEIITQSRQSLIAKGEKHIGLDLLEDFLKTQTEF